MTLTAEQRALWNQLGMDESPRPSGEQTPEQAINLAVDSFRFLCRLDGLPVPAEADVRAEGTCSWSVGYCSTLIENRREPPEPQLRLPT